jgi:hypothetical protein
MPFRRIQKLDELGYMDRSDSIFLLNRKSGNDDNTIFLLDSSKTPFKNVSSTPSTITYDDGLTSDNNPMNQIFGKNSLKAVNDGSTTNYIEFTLKDEVLLPNGFTLDFWLRVPTFTLNVEGFAIVAAFSSAGDTSDFFSFYKLSYNSKLRFIFSYSGGIYDIDSIQSIASSTYQHIAVTSDGKSPPKLYIDGVFFKTTTQTPIVTGVKTIKFGIITNTGSNEMYIAEARLSNIVRWDSDFTPPTKSYY